MIRLFNVKNKIIVSNIKSTQFCVKSWRNFHKIESKDVNKPLFKSANAIRQEFLDHFLDLNHKFIPSSRVVPLCDPSVSFVNAGMNQFKGVFLNRQKPPASRVTNSQKCIRVGGKHNDIKAVGHDSYHHTFFEMLGNWSFRDYKKSEACAYALNLLTGPFGINKNHLYVTYFGGEESLGLVPDFETKEIWLSLGLQEDKILPFGTKDNFWEMGQTGPCGPCTEIHIDHTCQSSNQAFKVNQGHSDLTELWNIVSIEHQRHQDGSITPLENQYIDTGMGFERLVAILQGKTSNYDTDLFQPLFNAIQKSSGAPVYQGKFGNEDIGNFDTGYRILADHARMVSVALADGMIPEQNHKLRRILRKASTIGTETFKKSGFLEEMAYYVAESLGEAYPEIPYNIVQIQMIIRHEEEILKALKLSSGKGWKALVENRPILGTISEQYSGGLVQGYKTLQNEISKGGISKISGELAFKLYDTHGLDLETISELAEIDGLTVDEREFNQCLKNAKMRSRVECGLAKTGDEENSLELLKTSVPPTDDSYKYNYTWEGDKHHFPILKTKIVGLMIDGKLVRSKTPKLSLKLMKKCKVGIILEKTLMYSPEGGQVTDHGSILIRDIFFTVNEVKKLGDCVIHVGKLSQSKSESDEIKLSIGEEVSVAVHRNRRMALMRNHTATHLLNAALKKVFPAVSQRGSVVGDRDIVFYFNGFGRQLYNEDITILEKLVNDCIKSGVPVKTKEIDSFQLEADRNLTLIPGEVYPDKQLRIVEIESPDLTSREPCCGTHVCNTSALEEFKIVEASSRGPSSRIIKAIVGSRVQKIESVSIKLAGKNGPIHTERNENPEAKKEMIDEFLRSEMKKLVKSNENPFIIHCIELTSVEVESIPLQKAIEYCGNIPVFLITRNNRKIRSRCFVPKDYLSSTFNAKLWMDQVAPILKSKIGVFEDEDPMETSHTRVTKLKREEIVDVTNNALAAAAEFASSNLRKDL